METKKNECCGCDKKNEASKTYPGVAVDIADNDKVSEELVAQRTREMNNNPRSESINQ